jgi:hypothetical protein
VNENDNGEATEGLRHWERKAIAALLAVLTSVFAIWAGIVYSGVNDVVREVRQVRDDMNVDRVDDERYRSLAERRLAILEDRQAEMIRRIGRLEEDNVDDRIRRAGGGH